MSKPREDKQKSSPKAPKDDLALERREFLGKAGKAVAAVGFGLLGFGSMLSSSAKAASSPVGQKGQGPLPPLDEKVARPGPVQPNIGGRENCGGDCSAVCSSSCTGSCTGYCYGCEGSCEYGCLGSCEGLCYGCYGSCEGSCLGCSGGCSSSCYGCCFLTTACVQAKHLPDDCEELTTMRWWRDHVLEKTAAGRALVTEYYQIAPALVAKLSKAETVALYDDLVLPCVALIKAKRYDAAAKHYYSQVRRLQAKHLQGQLL